MMIEPEDIRKVMGLQAKKVCSKVFRQRPNATDDTLKQFIVVSLPYSEVNKTLGESDDWWLDMTVVFEIYVADLKTAHNPKDPDDTTLKSLRSQLKALFPVIDESLGIKITRPRTVIPSSSDGEGYHYTRVQARMSTLI